MSWEIRAGETLALLRDVPDASIDALITDPPYSSGGQFRGDRMQDVHTKYTQSGSGTRDRPEFAGDNRDQRAYAYWCTLWLAECGRALKRGAPVVLFTDWRQLPTTTDLLQAGGLVWRGLAVWDKTEACRPYLGGFRQQCEYLVWGTNGPRNEAECAERGTLPGVLRVPNRRDDKHHVTGKPTELMRQVVRICPPDGLILDPFAGSGTTLVAALAEGRRAIGFERVPEYVQIASDRCRAAEERRPYLAPVEQAGLFAA
jgi:site-specific DNA-methyltransferase (adenine-specific)